MKLLLHNLCVYFVKFNSPSNNRLTIMSLKYVNINRSAKRLSFLLMNIIFKYVCTRLSQVNKIFFFFASVCISGSWLY